MSTRRIVLCIYMLCSIFFFFFFKDTATTEIYTLSLHDALPIYGAGVGQLAAQLADRLHLLEHLLDGPGQAAQVADDRDRKSTRLNSSHANISYAVFCLKKKKKNNI